MLGVLAFALAPWYIYVDVSALGNALAGSTTQVVFGC